MVNATQREAVDLLIIPDGNRRWAIKELNKPLIEFSKEDYDFAYNQLPVVISNIIKTLNSEGITRLYFWCNSVDNLINRDKEAVESFFGNYLKVLEYCNLPVKIHLKGDLELLKEKGFIDIYNKFKQLEKKTLKNERFDLYYFLNYSTINDIKQASRKKGNIIKNMEEPENIDLILRTGGYSRLSGFSPVRSPNAEIFFCPELFPNLQMEKIIEAVNRAKKRKINGGS